MKHDMPFAICIAAIAAATVFGTEPIPIENPGFEADFAEDGCFPVFTPTSWELYDPNGIVDNSQDAIGVLNPTNAPYFPDGAPEGTNVGLVFLAGDIGGGHVGFAQKLDDVLQPSTIYRLHVQVGNIASGISPPPCDVFGFFDLDGFPGYRVELRAGDEILGFDHNSLFGILDEGEFLPTTVRAVIPAQHDESDESLVIRLINLNEAETPEDPGIEVDFDAVALDATTVDFDALVDLGLCLGGPEQTPACDLEFADVFDLDRDADLDLEDYAATLTLQ